MAVPEPDPLAAARIDRALPSLLARALRARRGRALLAISGIAIGMLLVLVLFAAFRNPAVSVSAYVAQPGVDLWVMPIGTDNLIRTAGFLPMSVAAGIGEMPGVAQADPLLRVFVRVEPWRPPPGVRERTLMLLALGYRVPDGLGSPSTIAIGRAPRGESEVALDRAAAHRLGVGVGDTLVVNGQLADVVGLTRTTNLLITQLLFFDAGVVGRASGLDDQTSFVLVRTHPGQVAATASRIREAFPGLLVLSREAFERNSLREAAAGYLPVLTLVTVLGVLAGAVLIALLVQGLVEDRRADIAVLLAMGTGLGRIGNAVVAHACLLVAIGSALGLVLSITLGAVLDRLVPTIQLTFLPADVAIALAAFAFAGGAGALAPVLRLRRIDPLEAFRS